MLARAAYEAGEYRLARENVEQVLRGAPRESAYLLLADIEEAETGDQGKVRQLLAQALKAPRDPAWTADGYVSEQWSPVSPVTGRLNSFEWKVPVEQIAPVIEIAKPEIMAGETEIKAIVPVATSPEKEREDVEEAQVIIPDAEPVKPVSPEPASETTKSIKSETRPLDDAVKPVVLDAVEPDIKLDKQGTPAHIIVDDPGIDEMKSTKKASGSLKLF